MGMLWPQLTWFGMSEAVLLDTHVWIWLMIDEALTKPVKQQIEQASSEGHLYLSAISIISIWELGMLTEKGRIALRQDIQSWVTEALTGIQCVPLTAELALASTQLLGEIHGDPADRMIVATARAKNALLLTRDDKILGYGDKGYLKTLAV